MDNFTPITSPDTEDQDGSPVAIWAEDPMVLCRWCGFMVRFGRGPVERIDFCNLCKSEGYGQ